MSPKLRAPEGMVPLALGVLSILAAGGFIILKLLGFYCLLGYVLTMLALIVVSAPKVE